MRKNNGAQVKPTAVGAQHVKKMNIVELSHKMVADYVGSVEYAVDATLGGGRDALFAASLLREGGKVFGFDVQRVAVERSRALFEKHGLSQRAEFFEASHADMKKLLLREAFGKIGCFFFNLGWLPYSDKSVITRAESTLAAVDAALEIASAECCALAVVCYKAHEGGMEEFLRVEKFFETSALDFTRHTDASNKLSPELFFVKIGKKRKKSV